MKATRLALLLAAVAGGLFAQESTGRIAVHVIDPSGAAVANAQVELSGGSLPKAFSANTDASGAYTFAQIPAGAGYSVSATASGFRTSTKQNLTVVIGLTEAIDMKLEVGQTSQVVEVSADAALIDTESSTTAVTIDKSFFDNLPKGRSFYDLIGLAPGARNEGKSGGFQVDGASGAENTFFLNGMEVEDIQGGQLSGQNRIPVEMVEQVDIKDGLMEAQFGGAMGGVVSAALRSGSNQWHGQAGFYLETDQLDARPRTTLELDPNNDSSAIYYQNPQDKFQRWNPVFTVGGPILKNRLFAFVGYMPQFNHTERKVNFTTGQTATYKSDYKQQYFNSRVDYVPVSKIRMNMSWIFNPNKTTGSLPSTTGTDSYSNNWSQQGNFTAGNILAGQIDYLATSRLVLSFRGGYTYTDFNNLYGIPATTAIYYSGKGTTVPPPALQHPSGWIQQATAADSYDKNTRMNLNADASYVLNWGGQHSLKGGWQMNDLHNDVLNSSYPYGYYRYYWGLKYSCQTSACNPTDPTTLKGYGTDGYYRYRVLGTIGGASSQNHAIFLQDNWKVTNKLTLNLGLRTEHEFVPGFNTTGKTTQAIVFDWPQKMSPRIGFAFDPTGAGKQKISGGFGYFYDIMKYSLPRGSFGGDVWKEYFYTLDDPNLVTTNKGFAANPTGLPGKLLEVVDYRIPSNAPGQNLVDPHLKPMKQQTFDLAYSYSISNNLLSSIRYTNRRLISTVEDIGYVTPDGETYNIGNPGYGTVASAANWKTWMGPGIPTTPKAKRDYDAVEFRLDRRFSRNYQFTASYTWSRLYGNYSGLASSDEGGRDNPNNSRYFDQPWIYGDAHGKLAEGRLATDRPNTVKLFATYTKHTILGDTTLSPIVSLFSGTPLTSEVQLIDTQGWVYYNGRGDMGRTPFYKNFDLNLKQDFRPLKNHESVKVRAEFSVFNLFNNSTVTDKYTLYSHTSDGAIALPVDQIQTIFSQGVDVKGLMNAQGIRVDPQYGLASAWQAPRSARIQISLFF